ncbi:MAG: hypothetical protein HQK92_11195 [Nitrospirae bacterium]|nr:hypothetical protein [Nitrospirota bacterium]
MKRGMFLAASAVLIFAILAYGCAGLGVTESSDGNNTTLGVFGQMVNGCKYEATDALDSNGNQQKVWAKVSCGSN